MVTMMRVKSIERMNASYVQYERQMDEPRTTRKRRMAELVEKHVTGDRRQLRHLYLSKHYHVSRKRCEVMITSMMDDDAKEVKD